MATLAQNQTAEQTALSVFNFQSNDVNVVTDDKGEPWFLANDVCSVLGYANPRQAIIKNCRQGGVSKRDTPTKSGIQEMTYINEGNLYRLIIKSRKPEAEPFESWVCDEVLPSIRKTGKYELPTPSENPHLTLTKTIKAIGKGSRQNYSALYTRVYEKFQVNSYKELTVEQCQAAIEFVKSVEGEFIGRDKIAAPKDKINDGEHYFVVKDGVVLWEKTLKSHCDDIPENVIQNPALMLEHIRQVVGEFVGKGALPAPKPSLDINYPAITARPPKSFNANQHWFKADDFVDGNFDPVRDFLIGLETAGYEVTGLQIINQAKTWVIQQQAKAIKQIDKGYRYIADGLKLNNDYGMNVSGFVAGKGSM